MTDTPKRNGTLENGSPNQFSARVLAQYIRDMSFENSFAQNDFASDSAPEISIEVTLRTRKRSAENQYEVITKLVASSKSKNEGKPLFLLELEYAGIFETEIVPEDQLSYFLLVECPRITFPFIRRIAMDTTRDGGFPPLNLDNINFHKMFEAESKRRSERRDATPSQA